MPEFCLCPPYLDYYISNRRTRSQVFLSASGCNMSTSLEHGTAHALSAEYIQVLNDVQTTKYGTMASCTVLLYDILLTLDSEYEFVWKSHLSPGMILYVIMRYGSMLLLGAGLPYFLWPDIPFKFCKIWFYIDTLFGATLMVIPVFGILALRTYALYYQNPIFKRVLIFLYVSVIALLIACLIIQAATVQIRPAPGLMCIMGVIPAYDRVLAIQFSAPVAYDCIIFILTIYRITVSWRDVRIVKLIFWDCLLYYSVMVISGVASIALFVGLPVQRAALNGILIHPMRSFSVILASRLVLRLRQYVREPDMSLMTLSTPPPPSDDWEIT